MNKRHYEHTLPNIRGSLSNTYYRITSKWELHYKEVGKDLNNPKIPLKYVRENGIPVFKHNEDFTLYQAEINR